MAKQSFSVGQVLTAAQMTSLQQTAMLGGAASAKTANYTLVAADAGTGISMSSTSATTVTVNTGLFAAGDTVQITNLNTGVCTITAGTATVNTSASLALAQYESGTLYFTSASASIFIKGAGAGAAGGKILQVVSSSTTTPQSLTIAGTFVDGGLSQAITPSSATSKILILIRQPTYTAQARNATQVWSRLVRGASQIAETYFQNRIWIPSSNNAVELGYNSTDIYLDSPSTTSATTYKLQYKGDGSSQTLELQYQNSTSQIILMEVGA
jgi:hypothetical protein